MSLRQRLSSGIGASAYARAVSLLGQLALVPILIHSWGAASYGAWLTLTSLASYLSQTSLGLIPAARSDMAMSIGRGDRSSVLETFQTGLIFVAISSAVGGIAFFGLIMSTPILSKLNVLPIQSDQALLIIQVLTIQIFLNIQSGVIFGGLSALGHYGLAQALDATRQLADFISISLLVLVLKSPPEVAVLTYALTASILLVTALVFLARRAPWLKVGVGSASWAVLSRLWQPMIGGLGLSFGYSGLVIQAPRLILAATTGPVSVAIFSLATMLLRLIRLAQELIVFPVGVEVARAFGTGDYALTNRLFLVTSSLSFWVFLLASPFIVAFGPWFITFWTAGGVTPSRPLIAIMALAGLLSSLSMPAQQALLSINRLIVASLSLVLVAIPTLLISVVLARHFGAIGMAIGVCILEGAFLVALVLGVGRRFKLGTFDYVRAHAIPPIGMLLSEARHLLARVTPSGRT